MLPAIYNGISMPTSGAGQNAHDPPDCVADCGLEGPSGHSHGDGNHYGSSQNQHQQTRACFAAGGKTVKTVAALLAVEWAPKGDRQQKLLLESAAVRSRCRMAATFGANVAGAARAGMARAARVFGFRAGPCFRA